MDILEKIKSKKIVGLAPMAGYTDSALRTLCKKFGADLVYSEMISADGIYYDHKKKSKSLELAKFKEQERPIFVQLFGKDPEKMAKAAKIIIQEVDPDGIDINMGCPAHRVVSSFHGASLMRDPELAAKIVEEVKKVVGDKVLSVKTRLGWSDKDEIFNFAKLLEDAGADILAIHCRTKTQGFAGEPDWSVIKKLKKVIKIPILANGGIKDWQSAYKCLDESEADGILIGQAAIGKPWLFKEIKDKHNLLMSRKEIAQVSLDQVKLFVNSSSKNSIVSLRGQLIQYWKGFENASILRSKIIQCETLSDYKNAIKEYLN